MNNIAIRVENLSKLYPSTSSGAGPSTSSGAGPATSSGAGHIGRARQRHDTLRDAVRYALADFRLKMVDWGKRSRQSSTHNPQPTTHNPQPITHNPHPDDTLWALRDVSFEACPEVCRRLQRGEVVGVIGRPTLRSGIPCGHNGAGKSTGLRRRSPWLKILSRITEPTSGRAEIHGRACPELAEGWAACWKLALRARRVGTGFHPELTGRDARRIYLNRGILSIKRVEIGHKFSDYSEFVVRSQLASKSERQAIWR